MTQHTSVQVLTAHQLSNGLPIPQIQLGLYMMTGREVTASVPWALAAGYRAFDCAQMYRNEREAGRAVTGWLADPAANTAGLRREDVFYTSKLASNSESYEAVRASIARSVEITGLGYADLFLLHSPYGGREARLTSWRALEDAVLEGEVKMAGVSNYGSKHVSAHSLSPPRVFRKCRLTVADRGAHGVEPARQARH